MFLKFSHLFSLPFLFICILTFQSLTIKASPTFLYRVCQNTNTTSFSSKSSYKTNLNTLLSSLESNSTTVTNGFYNNNTVGNQASNTVYGLFLCRGDVSNDTCQTCVTATPNDLNQSCSSAKVGITFYDECLLRYSNESIVSTPTINPIFMLFNSFNMTIERDKFIELVGETMNDIKGEAARWTDKKFATKEAKFMFEIYPFYNSTLTTAPAPAPVALSPPTTSTNTTAPPPTLESKAGKF
ncbi:Gnk2-homologous domain [Dillenia turbinata]|uniref:Gnk2-homologous domain n=1 Tax=Dillenia turbinata TaxID=194707 RepID=A0AAN8UXS2_9MAGN